MAQLRSSSLFFGGPGANEKYEALRLDPEYRDVRDLIERMWEEYHPYADSAFLSEAQNGDFEARYWELYLGCALTRQAIQIEPRAKRRQCGGPRDKGPDFKIIAPGSIWIEASVPGTGDTMDAVAEAEPGIAHAVPDDEAKLRLLSKVRDKAKDRLRFVADGCVDRSASYVIAVNTGRMPQVPDLEPPRIVRAVLGLGLPQVSMDLRSRALFDWRFQSQDHITRRSGKHVSVSTRIFLDPEPPDSPDYAGYEGISGVLSSGITPFCELWFDHSRFVLGDDFCLIHNPRAISRLPRGFLKVGREYWLDDDTGIWKRRVWYEDRARRGEAGGEK